ncbi:MAG: hypothetical protein COV46_06660 [Deltaproteobacteria bacterium CG11_big_fil_rev_8_21_14_0_20_49_13]|nr:MAG: hypothetical protein COV46_06660 [Deltaproteobacteria bacterium CG11_big_fil_rev_8_21_14_0_20_49_13]
MTDFTLENGSLTCRFTGRMDSHASMEAEKIVASKMKEASPAKVVFDLAEVHYIASGFVRICLQTAKSLATGDFSITNTSPSVMKIFVMTGLDKELKVS